MVGELYLPRPGVRSHYRVLPLLLRYLVALSGLAVAAATPPLLGFGVLAGAAGAGAAYLAAGIWLSRALERRMRWNHNLTSLARAARAKLGFILGWPVSMPVLIWRLLVMRFL